SVNHAQVLDAEHLPCIRPDLLHPKARTRGQFRETLQRVLVARLGVNRLTGGETDFRAADVHRLLALADEMHLDAVARRVPDRLVMKWIEIEGRDQLAV